MNLLICLALASVAFAKTFEETQLVRRNSQWVFLDKFCYDNSGGTFSFNATANIDHPNVMLLAYHDVNDIGFNALVETGHSCEHKAALAAGSWNISAISGVSNIPVVNEQRPRWWYIVIADCSTTYNVDVQEIVADDIKLTFLHTTHGLNTQFSYDEFGIFECTIFLVSMCLIFSFLCGYYYWQYRSKDTSEDITKYYRTLTVAMLFKAVSGIMILGYLSKYHSQGFGNTSIMHVSTFFEFMSQVLILGILLFVSRGFTISHLLQKSRHSVAEFLVLYAVALVILYNWSLGQNHPSDNRYLYSTEAGTVIIVMRVVMLFVFLQSSYNSFYHEGNPMKQTYIKRITMLGCIYLLSLPLVVVIASLADDWNRKKIVYITEGLVSNFCYVAMVLILKPGSEFAFQQLQSIDQKPAQADHDDDDEEGGVELGKLPQEDDDAPPRSEEGMNVHKMSMAVHNVDEEGDNTVDLDNAIPVTIVDDTDEDESGNI